MTESREVKIGDFLKRIKRPIRLEDDKEYKLVTVKMHHKGVILREKKLGKNIGSNMYQVRTGDFILSGIDARNGAFGIVPEELDGAIVTNDFWYFEIDEEIIDKHFFLELTSTSWFDDICKKGSDGTTQRIRLQKDKFFNQIIILPSIKAQKPFIKKFLNTKSLNSELSAEMKRQTDLLAQLRQSILQEAIEGKLTVQWRRENPDIEPASKLLENISLEKEQLIKEKKIKQEKPLPKINDDEIPFDVPHNWIWIRLSDILDDFLGGNAYESSFFTKEGDCQVIRLGNVRSGFLRLDSNPVFITKEIADKTTNAELQEDDILITMTGTRGKRDYCYTVMMKENDFDQCRLFLNQRVGCFRLNKMVFANFYDFIMKNDCVLDKIFQTSTGSANQANIGSTALKSWCLPLPPMEEQKEIVVGIKNLFTLCDELEQQINESKANAEMLMQAVLKEAFE